MNTKLNLRMEKVTQEMFDHLPGLLTRYQFQLVTGLNDHDLDALRNAGEIKVFKRPVRSGHKASNHKYYKEDAARIGKFKM